MGLLKACICSYVRGGGGGEGERGRVPSPVSLFIYLMSQYRTLWYTPSFMVFIKTLMPITCLIIGTPIPLIFHLSHLEN